MEPARRILVVALFAAGCPQPPPPPPAEVCGNGVDDDRNGLVDCSDPSCAGQAGCSGPSDGGWYGSCAKCGQSCTRQRDCLAVSFNDDDPLPHCLSGRCSALLEGVDIRFEVEVSAWTAIDPNFLRSMNTRFVLKQALSGEAVSCATVKAVASSKLSADANQIERSDKFNLLAYDVAPVQFAPPVITQPFLSTGTGGNFLIWAELWSGPRDSDTKLPTGTRLGWGCFESGPEVEPILTQHHWPGPTCPNSYCRTIRVKMPPPQ
ncbi:MAG: hypothetical protein HYZ28_09985 [Myxococcales bacterium]|nr:hypothetical protein [Myxococcales bacterium]